MPDPRESLTEALAASLFEWKSEPPRACAIAFFLREETNAGWIEIRRRRLGWCRAGGPNGRDSSLLRNEVPRRLRASYCAFPFLRKGCCKRRNLSQTSHPLVISITFQLQGRA